MPLADAQARDLWLVMLPFVALARFTGFMRPLLVPARLLPQSVQGGDLRRFLAAARFLAGAISDMDSAIAESGQRKASQQVRL
ncbi:MAG: hypothetical protein RIC18_15320 [Hoeflea sp.]|uniref:hypothetical protein n=1 Tax=Hoeflea sp. TaxID=1940281 RepID=UPI0032EC250B